MRRLISVVLALAAAAAVAGCGSSLTSAAPSPTLQELSYFPPSSPLVLTLQTDPNSTAIAQAHALIQRFPVAALAETTLLSRVAHNGVSYARDIRPLFGNPVAIGVLGPQLSGAPEQYLIAWVTKSPKALGALVKKIGGTTSAGTYDGAELYTTAGGTALAVHGATLLFARSTQVIDQALDRRAHSQGFTAAQYATATRGIAGGALMELVGNLSSTLATAQAAQARRIPWVAALKGYGASIAAGPSGLTIRYHLDTSGRALTTSQLPIAAGSAAPGVASDLPVLTGVRGLPQTIHFIEAAVQATSPAQYAKFTARVTKLRQRSGFDLNALVSTLTGNLFVASDTHTTVACLKVSDPAAVSAMIAKLARAPAQAFKPGTRIRALGQGLYDVQEPDVELTLGVIGDQLVFGRATPAELRSFAAAPSTAISGAAGAITFKLNLPDLLRLTVKHPPSPAAQQILNLLGDLTGSSAASPSGLTGVASLAIR